MINDDVLYHYTSLGAVNGIFQNKSIWATDYRYLNDKYEFEKAKELFLSKQPDNLKMLWETVIFGHTYSRAHCIFSLSNSPKVLSQWRSYADDGKGIALGFSRSYFNSYVDGTHKLIECVYQNHEHEIEAILDILNWEISQINGMLNSNASREEQMRLSKNYDSTVDEIFYRLLAIKNSAFEEEQESRFVVHCPINECEQRVSNGLIIPYKKISLTPELSPLLKEDIDLKKDPEFMEVLIPEIYLGPKSDHRNIISLRSYDWTIEAKTYECGYQ